MSPGFLTPGPNSWITVGGVLQLPAVEVGGPSKVGGLGKYTGMADEVIPLVPSQWIP